MARVGEFLANMLAGGLQEGQRRREEGDKLRLAQVSAQIRDPLTFLLLHQLTGGGGNLNLQDPTLRALLGLSKTPEQIKEEEKARKTGELEADPDLLEKQRAEVLKKHVDTRKEAADYLRQNKRFGGFFGTVSEKEIDDFLAQKSSPLSHQGTQPAPAPPPTPPPPPAELVSVISPEGKRVKIFRYKLDQAIRQGYRSRSR